jgi:hypothetical protein
MGLGNEPLTDSEFVNEMSILWQNLDNRKRNVFANLIRSYFDSSDRAELIIERMQTKIDRGGK